MTRDCASRSNDLLEAFARKRWELDILTAGFEDDVHSTN
jgi:hypothetical protein